MKKTILLFALSLLAPGCLTEPAPDTSTDVQASCTQDPFSAEPNTTCQQKPPNCTPLNLCTDASFQYGTCCVHFGVPAQPTTVGAVTCGNELDGTPTCISQNHYDFGLVQVSCVTVTQWFVINGQVESQSTTDCHLD